MGANCGREIQLPVRLIRRVGRARFEGISGCVLRSVVVLKRDFGQINVVVVVAAHLIESWRPNKGRAGALQEHPARRLVGCLPARPSASRLARERSCHWAGL